MNIQEDKRNNILIIQPEGELMGGDETRQLQERFYRAIQEGDISIVVDMAAIKWMNSAGLGMLMAGLTTLRGSGGDLKLARTSERVKRPIEITRLNQVIHMFDSVDEAIQSFKEEE